MQPVLMALTFGLIIGFLMGLLGGGGSILAVPVLVYGLGYPAQEAIMTSLAIVSANAALGVISYHRLHKVRWRDGGIFGSIGMVGAYLGSWLNRFVDARLLLLFFALIMLAAAFAMLRVQPKAQASGSSYSSRRWISILLTGGSVGFLTGFLGVGGGFLIVPVLTLVLGLSMHHAVGTSLLVITINSLAGLLGHLQYNALRWDMTLLFMAGGAGGVILGTLVAPHVAQVTLRRGFALFLLVVALYTLLRSAFV